MIRFNFFLISFLIIIIELSCSKTEPKYKFLEGNVFGTNFHIIYESQNYQDYSFEIDSLFQDINKSLSTYSPSSTISKINKGDTIVVVDTYFKEVYEKSLRIYRETDGVFDPTIGLLVNAWGFGPINEVSDLGVNKIAELMEFVGFEKVQLVEDRVYKSSPKMFLDFNAIAKGYGIDIVSRFLEVNGVSNYMVEIGGEVRTRGLSPKGLLWKIGIEKPEFDGSRSIQQIISLDNESIATSGNYRKFKVDSTTGEKYVHTIDTKTGYTAKRDLLSASVIGSIDCADVDGYATAFMAMGFEKTKAFLRYHPELKVFLIYIDANGQTKNYSNFTFKK